VLIIVLKRVAKRDNYYRGGKEKKKKPKRVKNKAVKSERVRRRLFPIEEDHLIHN